MTIPDYQTLMLPLLTALRDGSTQRFSDLVETLAQHHGLTDQDRSVTIPSGTQSLFENRVGWAKSYLKQAGLLTYPARSLVQITDEGKALLAEQPGRIDNRMLSRYPSFNAFRERARSSRRVDDTHAPPMPPADQQQAEVQSPGERMAEAYREYRATIEQELLDHVKAASPDLFKQLVIDLLLAMGYGGSRAEACRAVGQSSDGDIDGIINEDRLGLDVIYLQAKRREAPVDRQDIQKFVGALQGQRAGKGIFISTSSFTRDARAYAKDVTVKIILIEGLTLATLLFDHDVGVARVESYELKRLDGDYFEDS